jgi:hypothetical protein
MAGTASVLGRTQRDSWDAQGFALVRGFAGVVNDWVPARR